MNTIESNRPCYKDRERAKLERIISFRLPQYFFRLGIAVFFLSFAVLIIRKLIVPDGYEFIRQLARYGLVIGMLFSSLAKDKVEDEMTYMLRAKSYSLAFVIGVIYAIIQPFIDFGLDQIFKPEEATYQDMDMLPLLMFMMFIQLAFYHTLKKAS